MHERLVPTRSRRAPAYSGIRQDGRPDPGLCRYSGLRSWLARGSRIKVQPQPSVARSLAGQEHGRTIPLADSADALRRTRLPQRTRTLIRSLLFHLRNRTPQENRALQLGGD
jgi:hypothetical protein